MSSSSSIASSSSMVSSSKRERSEDDKEEEKPQRKKRNFDLNEEPEPEPEEDDSNETLHLLLRWSVTATPPNRMVYQAHAGLSSKPIRKQLTKKEVNFQEESKLVLSKSKLTTGFDVLFFGRKWMMFSVYGPQGKIHEMKMWIHENEDKVELREGWSKFVADYELKKNCDFITVWMFVNREHQGICLAIDTIRLGMRNKVSKRISKAVLDDDDSD